MLVQRSLQHIYWNHNFRNLKKLFTLKWLHVDILDTFNAQYKVTLPNSKRKVTGGLNAVTLHPSSPSMVVLQQMAHLPSNTATSWWWYPTVYVCFYLWVFMHMCSWCTLLSSMTSWAHKHVFYFCYFPLQSSSFAPLSFSLSLRGVSTEQEVPDDKEKMVWCCCHEPAVCAPGLNSLDTDRRWGCGCRGEEDVGKERKCNKKTMKVRKWERICREKEGTEQSRQATLNDFASWESNQILIKGKINTVAVVLAYSIWAITKALEVSALNVSLTTVYTCVHGSIEQKQTVLGHRLAAGKWSCVNVFNVNF